MTFHLIAPLVAVGWTAGCIGIDALAVRLTLEDDAHDDTADLALRPFDWRAAAPIAAAAACIAASAADPLQGIAQAIVVAALAVGAVRDVCDHILWPELFSLALVLEVLIRAYDGRAYDAAVGMAAFGICAWALIMTLQALRVPQGFGDLLPACLIGSAFSIQAGVTGIAVGFLLYALFALAMRSRRGSASTVPMGPAFALTSVAAIVTTTVLHAA